MESLTDLLTKLCQKYDISKDFIGHNVFDENAGDNYGLIFDVYVEHEEDEGLYGKRIMYFREDSVFNDDLYGESSELAKDLFNLADGEVKMKFQGNFKYTR